MTVTNFGDKLSSKFCTNVSNHFSVGEPQDSWIDICHLPSESFSFWILFTIRLCLRGSCNSSNTNTNTYALFNCLWKIYLHFFFPMRPWKTSSGEEESRQGVPVRGDRNSCYKSKREVKYCQADGYPESDWRQVLSKLLQKTR